MSAYIVARTAWLSISLRPPSNKSLEYDARERGENACSIQTKFAW